MFIRTLTCATLACAGLTSAQAQAFPNPGDYTQDYATAWFTEDIDSDTKRFQYAVINLGRSSFQEKFTPVEQEDGPAINLYEFRSDTPMITTYEIPLLTEFSWNAIRQDSIFSPNGWSWRLIDPSTTPGAWTNATGDALFDSPYRLLQWYVDPSMIERMNDDETDEEAIARTAIDPTNWLSRDQLIDAMATPEDYSARFGGAECGLSLWNEACAGKGFGFEATAGKVLGPDEVDWILVTRIGSELTAQSTRPQLGDPDLPVGNNGLSFNGGNALVGPAATNNGNGNGNGTVPEPSSGLLVLGCLGAWALQRRLRA